MAYLHCHKCDFSQDDFWDFKPKFKKKFPFIGFGYNPISYIICYIGDYWKPRRVQCDIEEIEYCKWKRRDPFSWWILWWEIKRIAKGFKRQKYWTYNSWQKAIKKNSGKWPNCPKCGTNNLDID